MRWFKKNTIEAILITLIILLAAFFRFYNLPGYMQFTGDEGRDALVIRDMLVNHHLTLIGPPTSVGNIYLGPLYYYMMLIPMTIFYLNPIAAAVMVAVIGVATVFLIYYLARVWFGKEAALLAGFLYAISPVTITYSNFSWNPNPAPFFTLLAFLFFYKAKTTGNFRWMIPIGLSLAAVLQMHYLTLILLPVFFVLWLLELRNRKGYRHFFSGTVWGIVAFLILLAPLPLFDLRHHFQNFHAFMALFTQKNSSLNFNPLLLPSRMVGIYGYDLITRYIGGFNVFLGTLISIAAIIPILFFLRKLIRHEGFEWSTMALTVWIVLGITGLSFYKAAIDDHYILFLSPAPYLLLGTMVYLFKDSWRKYIACALVLLIAPLNLINSPLRYPPNNQLSRAQQVAQSVVDASNNKPFNFALLAKSDYPDGYEFYLEQYGHKPSVLPFQMTDQLFVVCEDPVCKPLGNPKYEVAAFGIAKIESEYMIDGLKIYKMVHTH